MTLYDLKRLISDLDSDDCRLVKRVVKTLVRLKDKRCIPLLLPEVIDSSSVGLTSAVPILRSFKENDAILRYLVRRLMSSDKYLREGAASGLSDIPQKKSLPALLASARSERCVSVRTPALYALHMWYRFFAPQRTAPTKEVDEILEVLAAAAKLKTIQFRFAGFQGLCLICDSRYDHYLKRAQRDSCPAIRDIVKTWRGFIRYRNSNSR